MHLPKLVEDAAVLENKKSTADICELLLAAPVLAKQVLPGQFIHAKTTGDGLLLRRPISLAGADAKSGVIRLFYRIVGKGTAALAALKQGDNLNCLGPLGQGFDLSCERPLLVGGGMGIAPLIFLAEKLKSKQVDVLLGGKNQVELFWREIYAPLVKEVFVTTDDGSLGKKGFTVDLLPELLDKKEYDRIFVCGPQIMMEGVAKIAAMRKISCQVSLEKHMACGIGACLSCTCEGKDDGKRKKICSDGPVFWAEEVL